MAFNCLLQNYILCLVFFALFGTIVLNLAILKQHTECNNILDESHSDHEVAMFHTLKDLDKQSIQQSNILKKIQLEQLNLDAIGWEKDLDMLINDHRPLADELALELEKLNKNTNMQIQSENIPKSELRERKPRVKPPPPRLEVVTNVAANVNSITRDDAPLGIPIILFCHSRPEELKRTLNSLLKYQPSEGFPIYVSQDGDNGLVTQTINQFKKHVRHLRFDYSSHQPKYIDRPSMPIYYRICQHFKWGLGYLFDNLGYDKVIVLEDDMEIAPDFYAYFSSASLLLDIDDSLMCVSAWNDNGKPQFAKNPRSFHRTDCFPGLGWMMNSELWLEFEPKWPNGFWDDWFRLKAQRKQRSCIYPEVNRVYTFGRIGTSQGQFFEKHLRHIRLNDEVVDFTTFDMTHLIKEAYEKDLDALIGAAREVGNLIQLREVMNTMRDMQEDCDVVLRYSNLEDLTRLLEAFGLMTDHKDGIPRTSYHGIVRFSHTAACQVLFAPRS